jgi:hypothetical protein
VLGDKMSRQALDECVKRLEKSFETNKGIIEAEAKAIEKLNSRKDILDFRKKYIELLKNKTLTEYNESCEKKGFCKLIDAGFNLDKIATLRFNDSMLFTLGHMYNSSINNWYKHLPYVMKSAIPKQTEMYRAMNPELYKIN